MTGLPSGGMESPTWCRAPARESTISVRPRYVDGWRALERKIRRFRPGIVALVGVTLYRAIRPLLANENGAGRVPVPPLAVGLRPETIHEARVFVLPNPSGRNANFSYAEMLSAFKGLRREVRKAEREGR